MHALSEVICIRAGGFITKKSLVSFGDLTLDPAPPVRHASRPEGSFLAAACNVFLPGFGVGSFVQGDCVGGTIQLATQLIGFSLIFIPMASNDFVFEGLGFGQDLVMAGLYLSCGSRICGLFLPLFYETRKNHNEQVTLNIIPSINLSSDRRELSIGMHVTVRYTIG